MSSEVGSVLHTELPFQSQEEAAHLEALQAECLPAVPRLQPLQVALVVAVGGLPAFEGAALHLHTAGSRLETAFYRAMISVSG